MAYRLTSGISGESSSLGDAAPTKAKYFDPNKTNSPAAAATYTELYGMPTCYGARWWAWTEAPASAWSMPLFFEPVWRSLPGNFSHPECFTGCYPPMVYDLACDAGNAPVSPPSLKPPAPGAEQFPWKAYSADTVALQNQVNAKLAAAGYDLISNDGKLGPGTCGALKAMGMSVPNTCQSFTAPTKATAQPARSSWKAWAIVGGVAALGVGIGATVYFKKKG